MASKPALIGVAVVAAAGIAFGAWYGTRKAGPTAPTAKPMADDVAPVVSDGLAVQFVARSAGGDRALADGAAMKAGEAIRIRARSREAGYLLIARIDRLGGSHLVYPAGRGGQAAPMKASPDLRDLGQDAPAAVGDEVFVSLLCSRPFVFGALQDKLRPDALTAPLLPGCAQTVQRVKGP